MRGDEAEGAVRIGKDDRPDERIGEAKGGDIALTEEEVVQKIDLAVKGDVVVQFERRIEPETLLRKRDRSKTVVGIVVGIPRDDPAVGALEVEIVGVLETEAVVSVGRIIKGEGRERAQDDRKKSGEWKEGFFHL